MKNKRCLSAWTWVLIKIILIAVGVGIYYLAGGGIPQPPALPGSESVSSSIPQPPALPN